MIEVIKSNYEIATYHNQYEKLTKSCKAEITQITQLDEIFGRGEVYIRYFNEGYGQRACVWKKIVLNKYEIQYVVPFKSNSNFEFEEKVGLEKGSIMEIIEIRKNEMGIEVPKYGKLIRFDSTTILKIVKKEVGLADLGINLTTEEILK